MKNNIAFFETRIYSYSFLIYSLHLSGKSFCICCILLCLPMMSIAQPKKSTPPVSKPKSTQFSAKVVPTSQKTPNVTVKKTTPTPKPNPNKQNKPVKKDNLANKGVKNETTTSNATKSRGTVSSSKVTQIIDIRETGDFREDMLAAINKIRTAGCQCGNNYMPPVPKLTWNTMLEDAAINHARDMLSNSFISHIGSDGSEFDLRIDRAGYKWLEVGENVARGQTNLHQVINDWYNSPSHCKTMMNSEFKEVGAARAGSFWVQDFGKPIK
jgi:uncharacterized protein YkwD